MIYQLANGGGDGDLLKYINTKLTWTAWHSEESNNSSDGFSSSSNMHLNKTENV